MFCTWSRALRQRQTSTVDVSCHPAATPTVTPAQRLCAKALQALQTVPGVMGAAVVNRLPLRGAGVSA